MTRNYKSQQAPRPKLLASPGLRQQSLLGSVVLAAQTNCEFFWVGVTLTPHQGKCLRQQGLGMQMEGPWGAARGWGRASRAGAEAALSFGFGFGSRDGGGGRGQGCGPWDLGSDLGFDATQLIGHQPHVLVNLGLVLPVE